MLTPRQPYRQILSPDLVVREISLALPAVARSLSAVQAQALSEWDEARLAPLYLLQYYKTGQLQNVTRT